MSKPSTSAQLTSPISRLGWSPSTGRHDQPLLGRSCREARAHHDVGLLADHHHVAAGLDRQHGVADGGLGMPGRLHHHLDRQVQHHGKVAGGDVVARLPGRSRLRRRAADPHAACLDADIPQDAGRRLRVHVDGDAGAHARHAPGLGEIAAPEAAGADHAGLDLAVTGRKVLMVVHANVSPGVTCPSARPAARPRGQARAGQPGSPDRAAAAGDAPRRS